MLPVIDFSQGSTIIGRLGVTSHSIVCVCVFSVCLVKTHTICLLMLESRVTEASVLVHTADYCLESSNVCGSMSPVGLSVWVSVTYRMCK